MPGASSLAQRRYRAGFSVNGPIYLSRDSATAGVLPAETLDLSEMRRQVDVHLAGFLDAKARAAAAQRFPAEVTEVLRDLVFSGGKRVRPVLCVIGWHAAGGRGDCTAIIRAAASLEMFHAFALLATGRPTASLRGAMRIARFKTAKYTVERPLHIGAVLAGAGPQILAACSAFALPLGEAFQLRDDILGAFGEPARTGKSALEDLRAGKHTAVVAIALRDATPAQRKRIRSLLGASVLDESGAAEARDLLVATGVLATIEAMIIDRRRKALNALKAASFEPAGAQALRELADTVTARTS